MISKSKFLLVLAALSRAVAAAQEPDTTSQFEKIQMPDKGIEILYSKIPASVVTSDRTLVIGKGNTPMTCNMFLQKAFEKAGIKSDTSSFGTSHDLTCEVLYRGIGAGVYGDIQEESRSLISYLGQGLGIVARIGLAVAGGKAAMDISGAGAANVVATQVLTDTRASLAPGSASGVVERNTLFGDKEFVHLMRVCHPASKQCGVVLGIVHKDSVVLQDKLNLTHAAHEALVSAANVTVSTQQPRE